MRLTAKFLLAITMVVATTLGISTWLTIERERDLFDRDLRHDAGAVGWLLARAYQRAAELDGPHAAAAVLRDPLLARSNMSATWVPLDEVPERIRAAVAAGHLRSVRVESDAHARPGHLDTYVPALTVAAPSRRPGAVLLSASLGPERRYLRATAWRWSITSLALLCSAALAVLALGIALIARPTRALVAKARRVGSGDLGGPVVLRQRDELGQLGAELNAMTDQLAAARDQVASQTAARLTAVEQLRHADRLTTVGRMASGIAHELGTPLNVIEGRARMIQTAEVEGEEVSDSARIIVEQSRRVTAIVRQLLDFARRGRGERGESDLRPLAGSTKNLLAAAARRADVELTLELAEAPCRARVDDGQLVQVLTNLVVNAIQAIEAARAAQAGAQRRGMVVLSVAPVLATPPQRAAAGPIAAIALAVRDDGCGMDAAVRERIFEPFFTTKDVGQGTGLGLAVVHGIVADHDGWIDLTSEPGAGTTFTVYLPSIDSGPSRPLGLG